MRTLLNVEKVQEVLEEEKEKLLKQLQLSSANEQAMGKNPDQMDMALAYNNQDISQALQSAEKKQLIQVEVALQAIKEGNYGRCHHCHQPIPLARLQVMPNATMCVRCQTQYR